MKYLLAYLDSLSHWVPFDKNHSISKTAWQVLRDMLHSDFYFDYRPQEVALSIIYFTFGCYGVQVPFNEEAEKKWWEVSKFIIF